MMANTLLTEASLYPAPLQLFQISCNPIRPCIGHSPVVATAPAEYQGLNVPKGPYKTPEACYTFKLGQQLLQLCGLPSIRCEVVELECDPTKNKLAPYGVRKSLKRGWFLLQESLHLRGGWPVDQPLPTVKYEGDPKNKRSVNAKGEVLYQGQEWVELDTRIVDHQSLVQYCQFADFSKKAKDGGLNVNLSLLQAVLMRYVLGWRDLQADRNYVQVDNRVYLVDGESFSLDTMNPLGQFLRWKDRRDFVWFNLCCFKEQLPAWLRDVRASLASQAAIDLCKQVPGAVWESPFGYRAFLQEAYRRLSWILEAIERIAPRDFTSAPNCHEFFESLFLDKPKKGAVNISDAAYQRFVVGRLQVPDSIAPLLPKSSLKRKDRAANDGDDDGEEEDDTPASKRVKL